MAAKKKAKKKAAKKRATKKQAPQTAGTSTPVTNSEPVRDSEFAEVGETAGGTVGLDQGDSGTERDVPGAADDQGVLETSVGGDGDEDDLTSESDLEEEDFEDDTDDSGL